MADLGKTLPLSSATDGTGPQVPGFRLTIVEGPKVGRVWESSSESCSIGSHVGNDLVIEEPTVSRFHCEVTVDDNGARVRDVGSTNGLFLDGVRIFDAAPRTGSLLKLGRVTLRFDFGNATNRILVSERTSMGTLLGASLPMRSCFALMERAAKTKVNVLIEGETGTGKSQAAHAIHLESSRADGPFLVVDCGAIPTNLLESELFGHEKGSFTGASERRIGAFEEASGGTVFLDEIGELPTELQPKLLRVLENREIRRVGSNKHLPVDVRVIAATHRDLRQKVNDGSFREDLYYRLAVVRLRMPALRERSEDIALLADRLLANLGAPRQTIASLCGPEFLESLRRAAWPGNIRELRNYLERCLVFEEALPVSEGAPNPSQPTAEVDARVPYAEARRRAIDEFEHRYVQALLALHRGKVTQAAQAADVDRVYLYKLMKRHNLKS